MSSALARPALALRLRPHPTLRLRPSSGRLQVVGLRLESTAAASATSTVNNAASAAASTTKAAASAARDTASKATQGLSRVTSAAGPALAGAAKGVSRALGRVGGRTGRLIAFVEAQVPFVVYYSRVGLELAKMVFQGQKMAPPPLSAFQSYFQRVWHMVRNPSSLLQAAQSTAAAQSPSAVLQQVRNLSRAQLVTGGVVLAELLGFFTVGEMVGRLKLIGYHGESDAHH